MKVKIKSKVKPKGKPKVIKSSKPVDNNLTPHCEGCLLKGCNRVQGLSTGDKPSIMIVKGYPDLDESQVSPFMSPSGRWLKKYLHDSEIDVDDCYITYAVKCIPEDTEPPTKTAYDGCLETLQKEFNRIKPKYVLILGSGIVKPWLKVGFKKNKNCIIHKDGVMFMILDSLGSTVKKPSLQKLMTQNFKRFKRMMGNDLVGDKGLNYEVVYTPKQFKAMLKNLRDEKVCITYDIETTGTKSHLDSFYIGCIAFAVEGKEWVLPLNHPDSPFIGQFSLQRRMWRHVIKAMNYHKPALVGHNAKFDNKGIIRKLGEAPVTTDDTMLLSYNIDENEPNGLKELSKIYCNANDYAIDTTKILNFTLEVVAKYNAIDVYYTRKLWFILRKKIEEDPITYNIYKNITLPVSHAYQQCELEGVPINTTKLDEAIEENYDTVKAILDKMNNAYPQVTNWNSTKQVAELLFETLKMPILETTAKGLPSTSGEKVLPRLVEYNPIVQDLLDYREYLKLGQFLTGWKKDIVNGRLYPSFLIHGTVTGRPSCKEPNIQQVPRNAMVRSLIDSMDENWIVVEADYSQAELRIAAMMSRDPMMTMCFNTGIDIHLRTAATVSGVDIEDVTKDMRKKAKGINFGYVYGMGGNKFQEYARDKYGVNMTKKEAFEARKSFFTLYNHLQPWHERQRALAHKFGYVRSIIGRKRRLPDIYSDDRGTMAESERQSINSPVQGFGSDLDLISLIRITKEVPHEWCKPFATVHDAILMLVRRDKLSEVAKKVADIMTDTDYVEKTFHCKPFTVPIDVEVEAGAWGKGTTIYNEGKLFPEEIEKFVHPNGKSS